VLLDLGLHGFTDAGYGLGRRARLRGRAGRVAAAGSLLAAAAVCAALAWVLWRMSGR
jgi:hypothetical protein